MNITLDAIMEGNWLPMSDDLAESAIGGIQERTSCHMPFALCGEGFGVNVFPTLKVALHQDDGRGFLANRVDLWDTRTDDGRFFAP